MYAAYRQQIEITCNKYTDIIAYQYLVGNQISSYTYKDVFEIIKSFSTVITTNKLKAGDRVGLICNNSFYGQLAILCASYYNITIAIIDASLPLKVMKEEIKTSDIRLLLTQVDIYERIKSTVSIKALDICNNYNPLNSKDINSTTIKGDKDVLAIIFSSGTSDVLKPVMITYESILLSWPIVHKMCEIGNSESILFVFPLSHVSGLYSFFVVFFSKVVIQTVDKFVAQKLPELLQRYNPTSIGMIPKVFDLMCERLDIAIKEKGSLIYGYYKFGKKISAFFQKNFGIRKIGNILLKPFSSKAFGKNMSVIFTGSTKCKKQTAKDICDLGIKWINIYASTECGVPITSTAASDHYPIDNEGKVDNHKEIEIKINNPNLDGVGEIYVKSKLIMKGYFNDKELTKKSFDGEYFKTGDLGYIDDSNYLHVECRMKESIQLYSGKKISPYDLENILKEACPKNNAVTICGARDDNNGYDEIHAFFEDDNYSNKEKEEIKNKLLDYAKKNASLYPIKDVHFIDEIPKTTTQKIKREALAKLVKKKQTKVFSYKDKGLEYLSKIIAKHTNISRSIKKNEKLSSLGLDSLALISIAADIQRKYHTDIINKLNNNTKVQDLLKYIENKTSKSEEIKLRKIRKDEIVEVAHKVAECFYDYPLYRAFYSYDEKIKDKVFVACWNNVYERQNYTYINDEKTVYITIKKPGDKNVPIIYLYANPVFFFTYLKTMGIKQFMPVIKSLSEYGKTQKEMMAKYYNPDVDTYIGTMAVMNSERSNGIFFKVLSQIDDGGSFYFETQIEKNVKLYEKIGAKVVGETSWRGIPYYSLRREKNKL